MKFISFSLAQEAPENFPNGVPVLKKIGQIPLLGLQGVSFLGEATTPSYRRVCEDVLNWAQTFLERPHPELGRKGAVCPYVKRARVGNSIYITGLCGQDHDFEALCDFLVELADVFGTMPYDGDPLLRCILILFPDLQWQEADALFMRLMQVLRPAFVARRQMLGEFHQGPPNKRGLHNPDFKPLYAPHPLLAIRSIIPQDIAFLKNEPELAAMHASYFAK